MGVRAREWYAPGPVVSARRVLGLVLICVCSRAEKTSWLGIGRSPTGAGQWRPARCKLVEEEEGCLLNIYVDVSAVSSWVYV